MKHALFFLLIGPGILIQANVTKYTPAESCFYPKDGGCLTASGRIAQDGLTIACPRRYALGTRVVINNHTYRCDDRLSKKFDHRWDVFDESQEDAISWGVKKLPILILK
jgi:3D (Asp-Asp-Asp) domain-containing protein